MLNPSFFFPDTTPRSASPPAHQTTCNMTSTTKQTKQPDPDPLDFVWGHRAATARHRGSVDVSGDRDPVHDDLMDDDYHALPCGPTWRSFAVAAADFEDRGGGGHPGLVVRFLRAVPGLDEGEGTRHAWTLTSFHDDFYQDAHDDGDDDDDDLGSELFFSAQGLGSPSFGSPESGWFDPDSFDMSAFDDMPAWDDSPSSSSVASSAGNYFVDPALLHRPKRYIDRMGYRHRTFADDSYGCHLDSQERIHPFFDHVRDCSRMSQQTTKMSALFGDHRLRPDLLGDDNPFDQDPAAGELRMTGAMIALAELAATAATDLLLLATAFEAMSNLCCGLQGSSLEGSSKNLAPARLRDGVRERPTGGCPNWRLPLILAMAA